MTCDNNRCDIYSDAYITHLFSYHSTDAEQITKCNNMRKAAIQFAQVVAANTPQSPGKDRAIELIQFALLIANRAVSLSQAKKYDLLPIEKELN